MASLPETNVRRISPQFLLRWRHRADHFGEKLRSALDRLEPVLDVLDVRACDVGRFASRGSDDQVT